MRIDAFGKAACWGVIAVLMNCSFTQLAAAAPPKPNDAVLNREKATGKPKHWMWRDKRQSPSADGIEGIIALATSLGNGPNDAEMKIWIYNDEPGTKSGKLRLSEAYTVYLTENQQVNSANKRNKSFHYMVTTTIRRPDGQLEEGTRTFLITGTREKGNGNNPRSLRITTFTTMPTVVSVTVPDDANAENTPREAYRTRSINCSDYPDDAVLEEDEHELQVISGIAIPVPDPEDPWMSYSWP